MSGSDPFEVTQNLRQAAATGDGQSNVAVVERIGRYRIERMLGKGSFGLVYLAYDEQLNRRVAVKVPHDHLVASAEEAELYLNEARTVASLDHPNIVPVHDVGSTEACPFFVVSKYVQGSDLAARLSQYFGKYVEIAELIAIAAEALHYAHTKGVVHRDIKPSNILIDDYHKPYVVDFGLAIKEEDLGKGPVFVGTPAYMSPEQALGEGHRVDGRTDVYSLGVVLYELLCARRPFSGKTKEQLLKKLATQEPRPPRQIVDQIPRELERVCLRALARRAAERYTTALDMAEELWQFVADAADSHSATQALSELVPPSGSPAPAPPDSQHGSSPSASHVPSDASHPMSIVPKGLRSFDEHDADFFLELLPGPRDRHGLPPSIRFWKLRIEESDSDQTFSVGLIYGPSGCGKSSLVKAGLLPRLSASIEAIYVEAAPEETESRLLLRLRKRFPELPAEASLKDALAQLRRDETLTDGRKILIVLDQFEQWLHAHRAEPDAELVQALRQCDGGRVQCILMVRDDFWMAATRFMHELEVQLVEGHNLGAVDLFPQRHARRVLEAFGRAFGALPSAGSKPDRAQRDFLDRAIAGLSEDGKVVCVRLALFAEMVKDKPWTAAALEQVGGTKGVGVRFFEETFHSPSASPEHRYHQVAARAVLNALLPEVGTDIKGKMRSYTQLLEVSGYANRPNDFNGLMQLLDREIRLITPTDPAAVDAQEHPDGSSTTPVAYDDATPQHKYFQLTHDYLVPLLREWLTRKKKETRKGRAELTLADRASSWNAKPENRQLPTLADYLAIVTWTSPGDWTESERHMMSVANKVVGLRTALTCLLLGLLVGSAFLVNRQVQMVQRRERVNGLVDQLLVAQVDELPGIATQLEKEKGLAAPQLDRIADDSARPPSDRLRALYVLSGEPSPRVEQLVSGIEAADHQLLAKIRDRILPLGQSVAGQLWSIVSEPATETHACLRAAVLLAAIDPENERWQAIAPVVVQSLMAENPVYLDEWIESLRPVAVELLPHWRDRFENEKAFSSTQAVAARGLAHYADAELLCDLILAAEPSKWSTLSVGIARHGPAIAERLKAVLASVDLTQLIPESDWVKLRNAIVTLLNLQQVEAVTPLLAAPADPSIRTSVILQLREFRVDPGLIMDAYQKCSEPTARQALLLSLEKYADGDWPAPQRKHLESLLEELVRTAQSGSERAAAEWLLRRHGRQSLLAEIEHELRSPRLPAQDSNDARNWWINSIGQTMLTVRAPRQYVVGTVQRDGGYEMEQKLSERTLEHSFAVSAHEVTMTQYVLFKPDAKFATDVVTSDLCPANRVSMVDAMNFCRWLSEQEGVEEGQMCYPALGQIKAEDVHLTPELRARSGYRLLTEDEWECACRAEAKTVWYSGQDPVHLPNFALYVINSSNQLEPVGSLLPNAWGLFDMAGSASEWCQPAPGKSVYILRGGSFQGSQLSMRIAHPYNQSNTGYSFNGFRVARTLP